jgi:apolipoprotein N-acyltransferase
MKFVKTYSKKATLIGSIIFSSLCYYLSNGLSGHFFYLLWLAPVPLLVLSFSISPKHLFVISFLSYLIGKLSWFYYLETVAGKLPALIFTVLLPLIFALLVNITQRTIKKFDSWLAVFTFPIFVTAFEWIMIHFSYDGSASSIAYTQMDFLPIIQIASITGILGITFIITLIPSVLSFIWHYRQNTRELISLSITFSIIIFSVLCFGTYRVYNQTNSEFITAGLIVLDEKRIESDNFKSTIRRINEYAKEINLLSQKGVEVVVLPEKIVGINSQTDSILKSTFAFTAKQNKVFIVLGYANLTNEKEYNSSLIINPNGEILLDYNKKFLVKGYEDNFTSGNQLGIFKINGIKAGTAICKDLDYPNYIRNYGKNKVNILCVPAYDFIVDDWLHSRMAILRNIENGFSQIRTARLGRLTISDSYGRVNFEAVVQNGENAKLIGKVPIKSTETIYRKYGDWFGITIVILAIIIYLLSRLSRVNQKERTANNVYK